MLAKVEMVFQMAVKILLLYSTNIANLQKKTKNKTEAIFEWKYKFLNLLVYSQTCTWFSVLGK